MSDRIAIMNNGDISQIGSPTEIYEKPSNSFVADFIGTSNFIKLSVISKNTDTTKVSFAKKEFDLSCNVKDNFQTILRPEHLVVNPKDMNGLIQYDATIKIISYQGSLIKYIIDVESQQLTAEIANHLNTEKLVEGDKVKVGFNPESLVII